MRLVLRLLVDLPDAQAGQRALDRCAQAITTEGGTIIARDTARQQQAWQVLGVDRDSTQRWMWTGDANSQADAETQALQSRGTAALVAMARPQ